MGKLMQVIKKNLLLLLRSRSSAFVVLFGPLFIIVLIGLAFTTSSTQQLAVGYYEVGMSSLTDAFVGNMEDEGFLVEEYPSIDECLGSIKQGNIQACILFPENFTIEDGKTNEVVFFVDPSRTNFVFQIIESVSSNLGVQTAELSKDLTNSILEVLWSTESGIDEAVADIVRLKASVSSLSGEAYSASQTASDMDLEGVDVDTGDVDDYFDEMTGLLVALRSETTSLITDGEALLSELEAALYVGGDAYDDFVSSLDDVEDAVAASSTDEDDTVDLFRDSLSSLSDSLSELNDKLSAAEETREETIDQIVAVKEKADEVLSLLDDLKSELESLNQGIDSLKVTSSETITNPITTRIEPVVSKSTSKLAYMFPYLLMLVVMFIGIMLSSTLIIMEKASKSSFRTFCTPTREELLMVGNFLTSFIVVIAQMTVLIAIAYYFLRDALIGNIAVALVILFLGVVFFIILGMAIGYLLSSQEGATMISVTIASVFLFLSNLILPLETLSDKLQVITAFNPYVITSEALRRVLLFGIPYHELRSEVVTLVAYSAIMFVFMVVVRDIARSRFYLRLGFRKHGRIFDDPSDLYLKVADKQIKSLDDLLHWAESVDDKKFSEELTWKELRAWLKRNHMRKWLRVQLAGKSREQVIAVLERVVESHK